jgi:nucleoside-triphosphatase THEP1
MRWALVSAARGTEKAEAVNQVIEGMHARGMRVAGFVQVAAPRGEDHSLARIGSDDRVEMGRRGTVARRPTEELFCSFSFDRAAFERAHEWLHTDAARADVIVVDEVSKLEVSGGGHAATLTCALALPDKVTVIVARAHQLAAIVERFHLNDAVAALELTTDPPSVERFCADVAEAINPPSAARPSPCRPPHSR